MKNILLPTFALASYLFYLFWSAPLGLILQMYSIEDLYIINNSYVHYALVATCIIGVILYITDKFSLKIVYYFFLGVVLFVLILPFLYNIVLPYNFGSFTDDGALTPQYSFLGFSKWYYVLDIILILGTLILIYSAFCKNFHIPLLIVLSVFYMTENIMIFSKGVNSIEDKQNNFLPLSTNKPNVLYLIFDGLSPRMVQYYLTNDSMPINLTNWSKDFTFYDNTTGLSTVNSDLGLAPMLVGYDLSPQKFVAEVLNPKGMKLDSKIYYTKPIRLFQRSLQNNAEVCFILSSIRRGTPILLVKIYKSIPYSLRHLVVSDYYWKFNNWQLWTGFGYLPTITSSPSILPRVSMYFYPFTHQPWNSEGTNMNESSIKNLNDANTVFYFNTKDAFKYLVNTINTMKKQGVYDNTTIIIAGDHGTHTLHSDRLIVDYVKSLATPHNNFSEKEFESILNDKNIPQDKERFIYGAFPTLLMVKHQNISNKKMIVDQRFLSIADIPGIIENSIGINNNLPDYTTIYPPKRVFNIPSFDLFGFVEALISIQKRERTITAFKEKNSVEFTRLESIFPFKATGFTVTADEMASVPAYEIIE